MLALGGVGELEDDAALGVAWPIRQPPPRLASLEKLSEQPPPDLSVEILAGLGRGESEFLATLRERYATGPEWSEFAEWWPTSKRCFAF